MAVITLVSDSRTAAGWGNLLSELLGPVGDVRVHAASELGGTRLSPGEPVIVAGNDVPAPIPAAGHDNVILAPDPFAPVPPRFPASTGGLRVLAFSSGCHAAAQRAGLRSALFQYFPNPGRVAQEAGAWPARATDRPPPPAPFVPDTLRAMAAGACICSTASAIALDYVVDGVNGFIGDPAVRWCPDKARTLGAAAHRAVQQGFDRWAEDRGRLAGYVFAADRHTHEQRWTHHFPRGSWRSRRSVSPVVTVATVVRNAAAALRTTLPSILAQRLADMEVLLFDGGSTDGTLDVIHEHADHIDHWSSAPDGGPYHAMLQAARVARGRWILFMNAGDRFVDKDALGRLVEAAREDADVVAGHHVYIDARGIESVNHCVDFEQTYARLLAGDLDSAWVRGAPCHQAVLTCTELIRRHGFDLSYRITADHEFMYRMRSQGASFQVVPTIVAEYVGGGLSARQEFRCLEEWRRIAHAYSRDRRRADRSIDRLLFMAMKSQRRRGPFNFSEEPARSRWLLAARIDAAHRLKAVFRRSPPN